MPVVAAIMTTKIPPTFPGIEEYASYREELMLWKDFTELAVEKRAIAVAFSLPTNDKSRIRQQVFDEMPHDDLKKNRGHRPTHSISG